MSYHTTQIDLDCVAESDGEPSHDTLAAAWLARVFILVKNCLVTT